MTDQAWATARRPVKRIRRLRRRTDQRFSWLRGRAQGMAHEMTTSPTPPADDHALTDRVRSDVLGKPRFSPYAVNIDTVDGVVVLRGQLDEPDDIRDLVNAVEQVPGVHRVDNFLHLPHTTAPNVAGLQQPGDGMTPGTRAPGAD